MVHARPAHTKEGQHQSWKFFTGTDSPNRDLSENLVLAGAVVGQADLLDRIQVTIKAVPRFHDLTTPTTTEKLELLKLAAVA